MAFPVRLLRQPRRGPAAARNLGIHEAGGDVILFTDADCAPADDWIAIMLRSFQDPRVAGCRGVYTSSQRRLVARFVQAEYEDRYRRTAKLNHIDFVDTYSAGYLKSALEHVGCFDERFRQASVEDQDLSFRVAALGCRLVFIPEARVEHQHVETVAGYWQKKFQIGFCKPLVHLTSRRQLLSDSHTPALVRFQVGLGLAMLLLLPALPYASRTRRVFTVLACSLTTSALRTTAGLPWQDPALVLVTPALVWVRSVALAAGLLCGVAALAPKQLLLRVTGPRPRSRPS